MTISEGIDGGVDYPAKSELRGSRDSRIWTHRRLSRQSFELLEHASLQVQGQDILRKRVGGYTLTLIYPREIDRAIKRSRLRDHVTAEEVYDQIVSELPVSTWLPVVGEVWQIEQYRKSIGVAVKYPDFVAEREVVREVLSDALKIRYDGAWHSRPHISFAYGLASDITNFREVQSVLPETVDLSPVYDGLGHMI